MMMIIAMEKKIADFFIHFFLIKSLVRKKNSSSKGISGMKKKKRKQVKLTVSQLLTIDFVLHNALHDRCSSY